MSSMSSDDFLYIEEEPVYNYSKNPFYIIASQVDNARMAMFEVVEIPHLCLEMQRCYFSYDMQCIKKSHQYMKQSISSSYYNEIKKSLQKQLSIIIKQQKIFSETYKLYKDDIDFQTDAISQHIINSLTHYFSSPSHTQYSNQSNSPHTINLVYDFSSSNESEFPSDESQSPQNQFQSHVLRKASDSS